MKLAYRESGSGQALIILHGLFGQSDNWNTLAKNFAAKGFCVYTIDQRNHGLSPHSDEWSYDLMAEDLKEFIDDHKITGPILLGHSMGAKTVMYFENKYPGVVKKIIIADMAARAYPAHHADVLAGLHAVDFAKIKTRKEAEAAMTENIGDFGTRQFLLKNIYWKNGENERMDWRFNLKTISEKYDQVRLAVPGFTSNVECLVIKGEASNYIRLTDEEDFKLRFPQVQFTTIEGAGHWVHAEKPHEFFSEVIDFITA